jgi:hypothetical protein
VYKGTYKGDVVAIKVLRSGGADAFSQQPDDSNYSSSGSGSTSAGSSTYNTCTSTSSSDAEFEAHQRRLTYEEFRHEVWIMRYMRSSPFRSKRCTSFFILFTHECVECRQWAGAPQPGGDARVLHGAGVHRH